MALEGDWVAPDGGRLRPVEEVPRGHTWVAAENAADAATDASASTAHGAAVPAALLTGRVTHVLWPLDRAGRVAGAPEGGGARVVRVASAWG